MHPVVNSTMYKKSGGDNAFEKTKVVVVEVEASPWLKLTAYWNQDPLIILSTTRSGGGYQTTLSYTSEEKRRATPSYT